MCTKHVSRTMVSTYIKIPMKPEWPPSTIYREPYVKQHTKGPSLTPVLPMAVSRHRESPVPNPLDPMDPIDPVETQSPPGRVGHGARFGLAIALVAVWLGLQRQGPISVHMQARASRIT